MYDHLYEHDLLTKYRSGFRFLHSQFCSCSAVRPVWSSLARFPRFCWHFFFCLHHVSQTFSQEDVLFTVFGFLENFLALQSLFHSPNQIVVCGKPRPSSSASYLKISANIFAIETALIWYGSCWGFFCVFSQSESICNLHSCYKFALVLQKSCTPFLANQNWVIFSCILLKLK